MQVISYGSVTNAWAPDSQHLLSMKAEGQNLQLCLFSPGQSSLHQDQHTAQAVLASSLQARPAKP